MNILAQGTGQAGQRAKQASKGEANRVRLACWSAGLLGPSPCLDSLHRMGYFERHARDHDFFAQDHPTSCF
jgi:hypothetical protein